MATHNFDLPVEQRIGARALFESLYSELLRLAGRHLIRQGDKIIIEPHTLVHEAFLRTAGSGIEMFPDRTRFFGYVSRVMRSITTDYFRKLATHKRNRKLEVPLPDLDGSSEIARDTGNRLHIVDHALEMLSTADVQLAELVDLHFFRGLTFQEIASLRRVSRRTVQRDWQKARMLLQRLMTS